jgi:hypothetical protein
MTAHEGHNEPVANPDRTVLDDDQTIEKRKHDQDWSEVADEVKEAVEHADGPLEGRES